MGLLTDLFSGGASTLVNSVGNVLDKVITTKGEKMQLDNELQKSEQQFQIDMKKLTNEEQQLVFQDVDSARKREAEVQTNQNSTKLDKNVSPILALGVTFLTFLLFFYVIFYSNNIETTRKEIIIYILGVLSAALTQIFSFYFGSSKGSADKNGIIANLQKK
jgi:ABC-type siderophore export system fused ATPase/permease subunit